MYTFLVVVMGIVGVLLGVVVLLQSGKGGGLAASFGGSGSSSDTFLGGRQAATLLTKASWTLGAIFLGLAIILSIMSAQSREPTSVLEGEFQPAATPQQAAPAPLLPLTPVDSVPAEGGATPPPIQPEGSGQPEPRNP
ncbi:MAG: preprotein translocase subunit SecG [Gemmatimonadota bacterium]